MKKISSRTTYFRKRIIPIILIINLLVLIFYITFINFNLRYLLVSVFLTIFFFYAWLTSFRKLKDVYLGNEFLEIENEKISFNKIILLKQISLFRYKIIYNSENENKTFEFMSDKWPFCEPKHITEIRKYINKYRD